MSLTLGTLVTVLAIVAIAAVSAFFYWDLRYRPVYRRLSLTDEEVERIREARKDFLSRFPGRQYEPTGSPVFKRSLLTSDGTRVYRDGVMARFAVVTTREFPSLSGTPGRHPVLKGRLRFVPFEMISGIYPVVVEDAAATDPSEGMTKVGMQMETRDHRVAVLEYGLDPGRTETAFVRAFGPYWRRLYRHDDPVASPSDAAARAVDDPNALGAAYVHKFLRGPRRGKVAAARPLPAREAEVLPDYPQAPLQPLGSIALDLAYLDESDVTAMDGAELAALARWMDDLLVQMRVPSSIEEGAWLDLTTSEKELVDLMIDRLSEAERHLGRPVDVPKLYLRLGNALDKVDLSREYDVPTAEGVYTMDIREPPGSDRIISLFDKAILLDPGDPEAWRNRARVLEDEGRDEEAGVCYQRLMELGSIPEDDPRWEARKLISLGRFDEAFSRCARAVELDPLDRESWYNMGMVLHNMGRLVEALDCYTNAIDINPRFARAWFARGRALESMGRSKEARASYEQAFRTGYGDDWPGPEPRPAVGG